MPGVLLDMLTVSIGLTQSRAAAAHVYLFKPARRLSYVISAHFAPCLPLALDPPPSPRFLLTQHGVSPQDCLSILLNCGVLLSRQPVIEYVVLLMHSWYADCCFWPASLAFSTAQVLASPR